MRPCLPWILALVFGCAEAVPVDGPEMGAEPPPAGCIPTAEACNGVDDDCDGATDEALSRPCASTGAECAVGEQICTDGAWSACPDATQGAEACNGLDDDCDGIVDEGLRRACGSALGVCEIGQERCNAGEWVACDARGAPGAAPEDCGDAADEDCDGTVDEGCACAPGERRPCGESEGRCEPGEQACVAGAWGRCEGALQPEQERCDGVDDDCDGRVDEDLFRDCGTEVGACAPGMAICQAGAWSACIDSIDPVPETCDGRDEDCDGTTDEGLTRPCGVDIGACVSGLARCQAGDWGVCMGAATPGEERCDGAGDEDCDGTVDEGCDCVDGARRPCGLDQGACEAGEQTCSDGAWRGCVGAVEPSREICDGRADEDCDGAVDEGCDCVNGAERACGGDVGACQTGTETCAAGRWGACVGGRGPEAERCGQGIDEDCDGTVDEGFRARLEQTTYQALAQNHDRCDGSFQRFGDHCLSAFHRRCNADCTRSGFGPVENNGDNAGGVCVLSVVGQTTFGVLRGIDPGCSIDTASSAACNHAVDQHCVGQGHGGGFGPVEYVGDTAFVSCVPAAIVAREQVSFAQLAAQHPDCDGQRERFGPACAAAIHRWCGTRGFVSGHGPLRIQGDRVDVMCIRR